MFMGLLHYHAQVKFWVGEFKCGRTPLEDKAMSGCPLDATNEEMCKKVQDLVYSDRRIQVEEIAQVLGISHGSVSTILHDRFSGLGGSVGCDVRLETRRSWVQPPPRAATFFRGDLIIKYFLRSFSPFR